MEQLDFFTYSVYCLPSQFCAILNDVRKIKHIEEEFGTLPFTSSNLFVNQNDFINAFCNGALKVPDNTNQFEFFFDFYDLNCAIKHNSACEIIIQDKRTVLESRDYHGVFLMPFLVENYGPMVFSLRKNFRNEAESEADFKKYLIDKDVFSGYIFYNELFTSNEVKEYRDNLTNININHSAFDFDAVLNFSSYEKNLYRSRYWKKRDEEPYCNHPISRLLTYYNKKHKL